MQRYRRQQKLEVVSAVPPELKFVFPNAFYHHSRRHQTWPNLLLLS